MENISSNSLFAYLSSRLDLLRLEVAHTLSEIIGVLMVSIVVSLLLLPVLAFLGVAAAYALATVMPMWAACCVMAGVFLLLMLLLVACRNVLFVRPIQRRISHLLGQKMETQDYNLEKVRLQSQIQIEELRLQQALRPINLLMDVWEWIKTLRAKNMAKSDVPSEEKVNESTDTEKSM